MFIRVVKIIIIIMNEKSSLVFIDRQANKQETNELKARKKKFLEAEGKTTTPSFGFCATIEKIMDSVAIY